MFEIIQDYLCKEIDKKTLINELTNCKDYKNNTPEVKQQLDYYIEDLKDIEDEKELIYKLTDYNFFYQLGIIPDTTELFVLATRTCGGPVPILDTPVLYGFIDAAIEKKDDERIFRLAYNYDDILVDKAIIEDYYIKNKNAFYINEIACNNLTNMNTSKLADALINIGNIAELKYFVSNVSDKQYDASKIKSIIKESKED